MGVCFTLAADQGYAPAGQIPALAAREQAPGICVGNANPILRICDTQSTVRLCLIGYSSKTDTLMGVCFTLAADQGFEP